MTPARRQRKARAVRIAPSGVLCGIGATVLLAVVSLAGPPLRAATTERIVADVLTGLALNGLDPVAYFTDGEPVAGLPAHELSYGGVIWRFRNEGNKAAFAANPEVYMPRYGGYDAIGVGRGIAVPGNPLMWARVGDRIYLFYDERNRDRFLAAPGEAILMADNKWPGVFNGLVP